MVIWSMFDGSGIAVKDWAEAGHECYCFNFDDADHGDYKNLGARIEHEKIKYVNAWIDDEFDFEVKPDFIMAFPPCTDLAVSGAAHFAAKRAKNENFQIDAANTCKVAFNLAEKYGIPYMIENPVSVLSSLWRKPDYAFHPYEYGGYLPDGDAHPIFPEFIKANDAYPKKTCLWTGNGFIMPEKKIVECNNGYSNQHKKLGGKSIKTKTIRSLTPRGFAKAVFIANSNRDSRLLAENVRSVTSRP
ncbi:hypothetical protein JJDCOOPL_00001 [Salmonella phage STP-SP1]|uniref:C-5 cytosine-specific DNA methylase n=1 Tax=Salmonella phage PRF-SP1 TaxID=2873462 RepID=A0AAE9BQL9_9CAUD|nr:hypothetical protein KCHCOFBK_00013 [Salmonella phage PRF-SP3]UIS44253.1 hypothetical protein HHGKBLGL_00013 [Salmonella phage PRF-SP5]UOL48311.1 hypothetical protein LDIKPPOO_00013 [Salmonella phage PRF-SP2]WNO24922.1 hypothetical protein GAEGOMKH_00043 [Salmonella phage PRF-SP11]WOZ56369.1 hypothetical protein KLHDILAF_00013 [Salmonella phage PRF-SP9]WOZ56442.1 hypothetical protein LINHDGPP_00037 [Salmonella phage PRF-SP10]WPJ68046.1 hypothetical protein KAGGKHMP_00018 [Salmonella phage 